MNNIPNIDTLITTGTVINYNDDGTATIETIFVGTDSLPNIVSVVIAQNKGTILGTSFEEGDLLAYVKNADKINLTINDNGELILYTTTGDGIDYAIDDNQNLTYTKVS